MMRIEKIDTPSGFHAVLIVTEREPQPEVRCVGFTTAAKRDGWLAQFSAVIGGVADTLLLRD